MLQELRESISPPITRVQLAEHLGRSPNYILKAESLTFPAVPPSLLDFYTNTLHYPRHLLISQYRNAQRRRRQAWLNYWRPNKDIDWKDLHTTPLSEHLRFNDWQNPTFIDSFETQFPAQLNRFPTEYAVSQGLCIPAAAVYNAQVKRRLARSILVAFQDLEDYCVSGEVYSNTHLDVSQVSAVLDLIVYWNKENDRVRDKHGTSSETNENAVSTSTIP